MLNDKTIQQELQRAQDERRRLKQSIIDAERDAERNSRRIQAAKNDIKNAEEALEKQKRDLERVLHDFKYTDTQLGEFKQKDADYQKKISLLELQLKKILADIERENRNKR